MQLRRNQTIINVDRFSHKNSELEDVSGKTRKGVAIPKALKSKGSEAGF